MGRHTGPVEKLSRREGVELFLKGERALNGKSALERRGDAPPGQHGQARRRKASIYQTQLRAKQTAKRYYGIREGQFRRYVDKANRTSGITGEELLSLLERRLDNVIYRLGFAASRSQARQLVRHNHFTVNGRKVNIPSYQVSADDVVSLRQGSGAKAAVTDATDLTASVAPWLQADHDNLQGTVLRLPDRADIDTPVQEQLIVEFYSK
jgi:small subunit ribosomal protein S4